MADVIRRPVVPSLPGKRSRREHFRRIRPARTAERVRLLAATIAVVLLAAACSTDTSVSAATTTTSQTPTTVSPPATTSQSPTTTVPIIDPGVYGMWTLDTDDPSVAWLNPPKHETITVGIAGLRGSPTLTTLSTTLGCVDSSAALHQLTPDVKADFPVFPAVSCGSFIDPAEDRLRNLVFHATSVRVSDDRLIFGNPPEQLVLDRAVESPTAATTIDPAVYGNWEATGDDPSVDRFDIPADSTLKVTVTKAPAGTDQPWSLEITLGCQVWAADTLAAHPLSEPLPDQMRAGCGPLATAEQGVAFTILKGDWPLSIDSGDLIFGTPAHGFYLHPAN